MNHDFLLIKKNYKDFDNIYQNYFNGGIKELKEILFGFVKISDDLILYMLDSLNFIKTTWPTGQLMSGIAYTGRSIIEGKEIEKLKRIIEGWKGIFNEAPEKFEITGLYTYENGNSDDGYYEKILLEKGELLSSLNNLIELLDKAILGDYYILHCGI